MRIGQPSGLFEHTWTIARWVEGERADRAPVTRVDAAEILADFFGALHIPAPDDAPANPTRGIPLAMLREGVEVGFEVIADHSSAEGAREFREKAVAAPGWRGAPLWLHGDLHPANVVVRDGMLAGVIVFGEMCAGDPATDLSAPGSCCLPVRRGGFSTPMGGPTKRPRLRPRRLVLPKRPSRKVSSCPHPYRPAGEPPGPG